jgi:drug/metabolite transporter (DMT)-like permease
MSGFVFFFILIAALMHACWNTLLKSSPDKNLETAIANFFTSLLSLPVLIYFGLPDFQSYPYILASVILHVLYFYMVASAYRFGDLNLTYPVMRGLAPIITLLFGFLLLRESIANEMVIGVLLISGGVILLGLKRTNASGDHVKALIFAGGNAIVIATYTITDGIGVRLSQNAWSYVSLLMFLNGICLASLTLWQRRSNGSVLSNTVLYLQERAAYPLIGGACIIGSYSLALWAMTQAPISLVAAVRETSVLFAFLFGAAYLKESMNLFRTLGVLGICIGLILIRITQ